LARQGARAEPRPPAAQPDGQFLVILFARLYAGIFEDRNGNREQAKKSLGVPAKSDWGRKATGGPGFMWQIARILTEAVKAPEAAAPAAEEKK
jgi:hypothetical protein